MARSVAEALEREGYDVWWDDELPAHRAFHEVIDERLREAAGVLVIWSEAASRSEWVRAEADHARTHRKLVQASADGTLPPMPFNQIHCVPLVDWRGNVDRPEWQRILASLHALIRGEGTATRNANRAPATSPTRPAKSLPRLRAWVAGLFTLVVLGIVVFMGREPPTAEWPNDATRVAVLPFDVLDANAPAAFAKALTNEVVGVLNENQLQAVPPDQAKDVAGADGAAERRRLGVGLVLGGSIRTHGDDLRVRVHLDDPGARITLWTNEFERAVTETDTLQTQVAVAVAEVVADALSARRGTRIDSETLALYIKAVQAVNVPSMLNEGVPRAALERALARHPDFTLARALLALTLLQSDPDAARTQAQRAIATDARNAGPAYDALFLLARQASPLDLVPAEDQLLAGLQAAPDFAFLSMRECEFLGSVGRVRDALSNCQRASALAPFAAPIITHNAIGLYFAGQYPLARSIIDSGTKAHPESVSVRLAAFDMAAFGGRPDEALDLLHEFPFPPDAAVALQSFLTARQSPTSANVDAAIGNLRVAVASRKLWPQGAAPQYPVLAAAMFDRVDMAFAVIDESGTGFNRLFLFHPVAAPLRRDVRFWPIAAKFGLIDYWRARNVWPDFCADKTLPYDCRAEADRVSPPRG